MANIKISALPASTTPLAGTEVLPIVQSSATKQVSVANLTAGRAVSAASVTASTGNFVVGTSGQGIDFSATPGTGTSELLADYETGTWTPTDASGAALTLTSVTGNYVKVGNLVTAYFSVTYPATASGNDASIGGLPFTSSSTSAVPNNGMLTVGYTNSSLSVLGVCSGSATLFGLYLNTGATVTNTQMSAKLIRGVLTYIA
jgi:hypothetical protein